MFEKPLSFKPDGSKDLGLGLPASTTVQGMWVFEKPVSCRVRQRSRTFDPPTGGEPSLETSFGTNISESRPVFDFLVLV